MIKRKTHEEFLKELTLKNEHYRDGRIEIIGEYKSASSKILVRDRYGVCKVMPKNLLLGSAPTIKTAVNKTSYWISAAKEKHKGKYNYSLAKYVDHTTKVKIIAPCGTVFKQRPSNHLQGQGYTERVVDTESFIKKAREVHKDKYDYSLVVYKDSKTKVKIIAPCTTIFEQSPNQHLDGHGFRIGVKDTKNFIEKATKVHNGKYDYNLVNYKNTRTKVKIICPLHTVFEQRPNGHLAGQGCPECRIEKIGWEHKKWELQGNESNSFDSFKVYQIECWDEETGESFYKIGKTFLKVFGKAREARFPENPTKRLPYQGKIIKIIESGNAKEICELEAELQNKNKKYKYIPNKGFEGMYECFSKIIIE